MARGEWHELGKQAASLNAKVEAAMREAAEKALMPRFRRLADHDQEEKSPGEVVTIADRDSEQILSEALSKALPTASIVAEEAAHFDPDLLGLLGDEMCWVVDPLDGTGYFVAGKQPFGIMVALTAHGRPIGGWILDPVSGRFASASVGGGAFINGSQAHSHQSCSQWPIAGLSPFLRRRPRNFAEAKSSLESAFRTREIERCAAAQYARMLLSEYDVTLYERTLPWDHAAGVLLVQEAGGRVARLDGAEYRVDDKRTGLLAAVNSELWESAAALIGSSLD